MSLDLGLEPWVVATIVVGVLVGATVQGIVGIGLNLVTAPVVALVSPQLMPAVPLWLASVYPLGALLREWRDADWRGLSWAVGGRVPGTAVGVLVVAWASDRVLGVVVGVMVLVAVLLTWRAVRVPVNAGTLGTAGASSAASPAPRRRSAGRRWRSCTSTRRGRRSAPVWRRSSASGACSAWWGSVSATRWTPKTCGSRWC